MNKVISSFLSVISFLVGIILLASALLTSEKSLKFILNLNQDSYIDFNLNNGHWHPYKPSIEIDTLSVVGLGTESKFIEIEGLIIEFNLLSFFKGSLIESLYAKDASLIIYPSQEQGKADLIDLWLYVSSIKDLRIDEFSLIDSSNSLNPLKGELSLITLNSGDLKAKFNARNREGGNLAFRMNSISGSKSLKDYKGFFTISNFSLKEGITSQLCLDCPSGAMDSKIWFTFMDLKLVKLVGDIEFKFNSTYDFIDTINAKIELENPNNNIVRISSFVNGNPANKVPEIFASLANEETIIFIPKIELGKDKFVNKFQHLFNLPNDLVLKGYINNLILKIRDSFQFKADFEDLSLESKELSISGLRGNFLYSSDFSRLKINTPYLQIDLGSLFDSNLIFNNLTSDLDIGLIDNKISISNSTFTGIYKKTEIKGEIDLHPSPFDDTGDLSLKVTSKELDYLHALNLFPNLNYTKFTKNWLQNSISCGSLQGVSLIYRGPIDNQFEDSSSSIQAKGFFKNSCLNINEVGIKNINLNAKINNSYFIGDLIDGDLYGSEIKGTVKTFKDSNNFKVELKGNSEGPLLSLLRLTNLNKTFDVEEKAGEHYTKFYFTSPLSSTLEFLGNNSNLELSTKIRGGHFSNKRTNLNFSDLYSSLEYDSTNGIKDGFATIKINGVPLKFDIKKGKEKGIYNTQIVTEEVLSVKRILSSYGIEKSISGSSKFNIKLTLASFIKGQPLTDPKIEVLSNLKGISLNLPEPITKLKDSKVDFRLNFESITDMAPMLSFKYGELFRGKFNLKNNITEGFVIAGKKKQNVSIEDEKILLIGELKKLDLGSFISLGSFDEEGFSNFFIKDLLVQETGLSGLSLVDTRFKSSKTKDGFEYRFINDDVSGRLFVPEDNKRNLSFKFDFIKINQSSRGSKDSFLYLYNGIKDKFDFSTEAIFYNGKNYGNWEFSILPEGNRLTLYDIKGVYGKWGIKNNNKGISSLSISKNSIGWSSRLETNIYSGSPEKAMVQIGIKPNFELDTLSLDTDLSWDNLPWLFNYESIKGEISINLDGLTIKNSEDMESTNNILRLVNIFNITDSFEKVTNLDFRKLYKRGFSADIVTGKFRIDNKSLRIKEPILLKSGSSQFNWTGDIYRDQKGNLDSLNLEVIVTLPLREYLPAYALVLGGPITAGVVYIAGKAFERNLDKLSSGKWIIKGDISKPRTEFDGWFEDNTER